MAKFGEAGSYQPNMFRGATTDKHAQCSQQKDKPGYKRIKAKRLTRPARSAEMIR